MAPIEARARVSVETAAAEPTDDLGPTLERRGRAWLLWSFLLCPCHLPLSLAALTTVLAGTSFGVLLRDHVWVAGTVISAAWIAGTAYGFRLIRRAQRANGACPVRASAKTNEPTSVEPPTWNALPPHAVTPGGIHRREDQTWQR